MQWKFILYNPSIGSLTLDDEPIGWAGVIFNLKRNMQWHGIFFEYAINLQFYGKGYLYIRKIYEDQGVDAQISISIQMKCSDTDSFSSFFEGKLVVPKCLFDCKDDCIVSVPIEQAGCLMKFKNRLDQAVDLNANADFDGNGLTSYGKLPFDLTLLPKAIVLRSITPSDNENIPGGYYYGADQTIAHGSGTQTVTNWDYLGISLKPYLPNDLAFNETSPAWAPSVPSINTVDTAVYTGTYKFSIKINRVTFRLRIYSGAGLVSGTAYYNCSLGLYVNNSLVASVAVLGNTYDDALCGSYVTLDVSNIILNHTQHINAGDDIKIAFRTEEGAEFHRDLLSDGGVQFAYLFTGTSPVYQALVDSQIDVRATILTAPTNTKAYAINESLSRIVEAVTNDCMRVKSDYFGRTDSEPYTSGADGCGSLEVITKGLLIRQFTSNMPVSFNDIYNALNAIHNIGMGLEPDTVRGGDSQWVRVEPMEYFYDSSTIIFTADNVPDIKKQVMPDMYFSSFDFGYEKWETENSMGLDEICTKRSYRSTLSEVQKSVTQVCKFIASGYSIEVTRNKEFVKDSTVDWRLDNDIFIICVRRQSGNLVVEQGQDCADMGTITDIIEPTTIYNYRISPIRNFLRWIKAYMADYFFNTADASAKFIFTKGEGNFIEKGKLVNGCILETAEIRESDDISLASFANASDAQPIYRFETDEFDYPLSVDELATIKVNPRGLIQYRKISTDPWSYGYIMNIQYKPNDGVATFTLLPKYIP